MVWLKEEGGAWKDVFRRSTAELRSDARDVREMNLESIEAKIREIITGYQKKAEDAAKASAAQPATGTSATGTGPAPVTGQGTTEQSE